MIETGTRTRANTLHIRPPQGSVNGDLGRDPGKTKRLVASATFAGALPTFGATNFGNGGTFTKTGALSASATSPTDVSPTGTYRAEGAHFGGSTYLQSDNLGAAASRYGLISLWLTPNASASSILKNAGKWEVTANIAGGLLTIGVDLFDSLGTSEFQFHADMDATGLPTWCHVLIASDTAHGTDAKIGKITVNRTPLEVTVDADDDASFSTDWDSGSSTTLVDPDAAIDLAEVWLGLGQYADVSDIGVINRFSDGSNQPVFLGTDGSLPTGTAPTAYFNGNAKAYGTVTMTGVGAHFVANDLALFEGTRLNNSVHTVISTTTDTLVLDPPPKVETAAGASVRTP